jgi:hypothetical protein
MIWLVILFSCKERASAPKDENLGFRRAEVFLYEKVGKEESRLCISNRKGEVGEDLRHNLLCIAAVVRHM